MSNFRFFIIVVLSHRLLLHFPHATATEVKARSENPTILKVNSGYKVANASRVSRGLLTQSDEYVARNKQQCFERRNLLACIKYKAAKGIWRLATNAHGHSVHDSSRALREDQLTARLTQLGKPLEVKVSTAARNSEGGATELLRIIEFLKRETETFVRSHDIEIIISSDTALRASDGETAESRGHKNKKKFKWLFILSLIILMKIAHLKTTVVTLLLGVLGLNVLLIGSIAWLIHYLKFKTLCKIHPQLVQSHSHAYDSDPAEYSQFVGSNFPGSHYSGSYLGPHEVGVSPYSAQWRRDIKPYRGYNYLDTISKKLK